MAAQVESAAADKARHEAELRRLATSSAVAVEEQRQHSAVATAVRAERLQDELSEAQKLLELQRGELESSQHRGGEEGAARETAAQEKAATMIQAAQRGAPLCTVHPYYPRARAPSLRRWCLRGAVLWISPEWPFRGAQQLSGYLLCAAACSQAGLSAPSLRA
jgi:hypothetical protein